MRRTALAALLLGFSTLLAAQQAMNNDSVVKLVKAGLSDDLIITTIDATPASYDTSADALIALRAAGASDKVIAAVIARAAAPAGTATAAAAADPNDPAAPHEAGVYLLTANADGQRRMVYVERAGTASEKATNMLGSAFSFGIAPMKLKAEIPGAHAAVRTTEAKPVFYMYFPSISSLGGFGGTNMITSPTQFSLLELGVKPNTRETTVASVGIAGGSMGADQKRAIPFQTDRVSPGVYKITVARGLKPGEYAFLSATQGATTETGATVVVYDFGVDAKK